MQKLRAIIPSRTLSKLPLMVSSNGKSVTFSWTPPCSRSCFFQSVSINFPLVRFIRLYLLWPFFLWLLLFALYMSIRAVQTACTSRIVTCPKRNLPVLKIGIFIMMDDLMETKWNVESWGLVCKVGNWLHMRQVNNCHSLVCWMYKRKVAWWFGAVQRDMQSWEDAVRSRSVWLNGECWLKPGNTV